MIPLFAILLVLRNVLTKLRSLRNLIPLGCADLPWDSKRRSPRTPSFGRSLRMTLKSMLIALHAGD